VCRKRWQQGVEWRRDFSGNAGCGDALKKIDLRELLSVLESFMRPADIAARCAEDRQGEDHSVVKIAVTEDRSARM
jgi:hypothetical protein